MNQKRIIELINSFLSQSKECNLLGIEILLSPNLFSSNDACVQKYPNSEKIFPRIEFIQKTENQVQIKKMLFEVDNNNLNETNTYNSLFDSHIYSYLENFLKEYIEFQK